MSSAHCSTTSTPQSQQADSSRGQSRWAVIAHTTTHQDENMSRRDFFPHDIEPYPCIVKSGWCSRCQLGGQEYIYIFFFFMRTGRFKVFWKKKILDEIKLHYDYVLNSVCSVCALVGLPHVPKWCRCYDIHMSCCNSVLAPALLILEKPWCHTFNDLRHN